MNELCRRLRHSPLGALTVAALLVSGMFAGCLAPNTASAQGTPDYAAIVAAPDRSDADRRPTNAAIGAVPGLRRTRPGMRSAR